MFKQLMAINFLLLLFIMFSVCDDVGTVGENGNDQPTNQRTVFGTILITLVPANDNSGAYTSVLGSVNDGPTPEGVVWEEAAKNGDCKLLTPRIPFCSNPCDPGAICVENDSCQTYPTAIDMGTVTVTGLLINSGNKSFSMDPINHSYQPSGGVIVAYPPFSEGTMVTIVASGTSFVPACTASTKGITPLELLNDSIVLEKGKPIHLQWTPPAQTTSSTIHVLVDINTHGSSKGKIVAETIDDGSLEISSSLIDKLIDLGVSGFPKLEVTRKATGSTDPASVDLILESRVYKELHIPGLISCENDGDCPSGQTCQPDLKCE